MKRGTWNSTVAVVNLDNVPDQGYQPAHDNTAAIPATASLIAFSEAWHHDTRRGIFDALPNRFQTERPQRNSSIAAADTHVWVIEDRGSFLLHGKVASKLFGVVSDDRYATWLLVRNPTSRRKLLFISIHLAPSATKRSKLAQRMAKAARTTARRRLRRFVARYGYPTAIAGDWNETGPTFGTTLNGREIGYSDLDQIDRVVTVDGVFLRLQAKTLRVFPMPHTDHPGGVLVRLTTYPID